MVEAKWLSRFVILMFAGNYVHHNNAVTYCPLRFPYAYNGGRHCCQYNEEKKNYEYRGRYQDQHCNGSLLTMESKCCKDDQYNKCPGLSCETPPFENDPCPEDFPHPYYHGQYCCKTAREKPAFSRRSHGNACQNGTLKLTSQCCHGNEYVRCVNPPCVTMDYWSLTWISERNDNSSDPGFTRKLRLTRYGPSSVVTIGKCYRMVRKMLSKHEIMNDLISAGLSAVDAANISAAASLNSREKEAFIESYKNFTLTHRQQLKLFQINLERQKYFLNRHLNGTGHPDPDIDTKHPAIKGFLLDVFIEGKVDKDVMDLVVNSTLANDVIGLTDIARNRSLWTDTSHKRFALRKAYMEKALLSLPKLDDVDMQREIANALISKYQ